MQTSYIIAGIILVVLILLFSAKYIVADKYTLREMLNAEKEEIILENELSKNSNNLEQNYTYSIWLYVNDWNYKIGSYKPIFGKFKKDATSNDDILLNTNEPSPVVVFDKYNNNILIYLTYKDNTGSNEVFTCNVENISIQKWVNLTISLYNKTLDVYINGKLHKTCVLPYVPLPNIGNVYITPFGGFKGYTSKFQYYPEALNPQEVWDIYSNGYGSLASTLGDYQLKMSLIENGNETNSITL